MNCRCLTTILGCLLALTASAATVERVEYFIGADPGRGQATALAVPSGQSSVEASITIPIDALPDQPKVQVTVRTLASDGQWSPPVYVIVTRPMPFFDPDPVITAVEYAFPESDTDERIETLNIGGGSSALETQISLPAASLPAQGIWHGWVRAVYDGRVVGPPTPIRVSAPLPDRFGGHPVAAVGHWHYTLRNGDAVLHRATATASADKLSGFDFRSLTAGESYQLVLNPVTALHQLPFQKSSVEIQTISDEAWMRGTHFDGVTTELSVVRGGTATLAIQAMDGRTYQWFRGQSGDRSNPIADATHVSLDVSPLDTTSYWVEISGGIGLTYASDTFTVDVEVPQFGLTLNATSGGSVSADPQAGAYPEGAQVTLTATPSEGFVFDGWSGNATGMNNPLTITMNQARTITANFREVPPPDLWREAEAHEGGLLNLPWFGWFFESGPWIYHFEHGWVFAVGNSTDSFFLYDPMIGTWAWTQDSIYPWIFWFDPVSSWTWYQVGGEPGGRFFFLVSGNRWASEGEL